MCGGKLVIKLKTWNSFFIFPFHFHDTSSPCCVPSPLQLLLLPSTASDLPYGSTNNRRSMTAAATGCYLHRTWKCRSRCLRHRRGCCLHHRHQERRSRCLRHRRGCCLHHRHQERRRCRFLCARGCLIRHDQKLGGHFLHHT